MSNPLSPRHPSFRTPGTVSPAAPAVDHPEVVRSPRANAGRLSAFTPSVTSTPSSSEPSTRLRPKPSMPDSPAASPTRLSTIETRPYFPDPQLSIRTTRSETAAARLLATPAGWRARVSNSTTIHANKVIICLCLLALGSTALVVRTLLGDVNAAHAPHHAEAACEPAYETIAEPRAPASAQAHHDPSHIPVDGRTAVAIVTFHDTRTMPLPAELAAMTGLDAGADVDVLDVVWRNRKDYTDRHGYTLIDATEHRGSARPYSWYKIKAVEAALEDYDWVFWLDPDAWITNPEIKLESVLPAAGTADMVITEDITGFNAGSWLLRSSDWSRQFLTEWWGHSEFIRVRPRPCCPSACLAPSRTAHTVNTPVTFEPAGCSRSRTRSQVITTP